MRRYMVLLWALSFMVSSTLMSQLREKWKMPLKNKSLSRYMMVNDPLIDSDSSKNQTIPKEYEEAFEKELLHEYKSITGSTKGGILPDCMDIDEEHDLRMLLMGESLEELSKDFPAKSTKTREEGYISETC